MIKSTIKLFIVWMVAFSLLVVFLAYKDIRTNKLFNFSSEPESILVKKIQQDGRQITTYEYGFSATDNYLGAMIVPISKTSLINTDGMVSFKIGEENGEWLHTNNYDYKYFTGLDEHILGFPAIKDSENVRYKVELQFILDSEESFAGADNYFEQSGENSLLAKYVFPRSAIIETPGIVTKIVLNRTLNVVSEMNHRRLLLVFLIINVTVVFVSRNNLISLNSFEEEGFLNITRKIFKPKYGGVIMAIVFCLVMLIPVTIFLGSFVLAEKLANYIWVVLLIGLIYYIISEHLLRGLGVVARRTQRLYSKYTLLVSYYNQKNKLIFVLIAILVLIVLFGLKKTYILGGDDSRLFYLYPYKYLVNFSSNIVSDVSISNVGHIAPPGIIASFTVVMIILDYVTGSLNLQSIVYSLNIIVGFLAFYVLAGWLMPTKGKYNKFTKLISSYVYVFSIFNIYTLYNSKLLAIFLVSIFPLTLYLILRGISEKRVSLILLSAILLSVFSAPMVAAPWYFAVLITAIPLLLYYLFNHKTTTIKYLLVLIASFLLLNVYWLVYVPTFRSAEGSNIDIHIDAITSQSFREQNAEGIRIVSKSSSVYYPLLNLYPEDIQRDFNWSYYPIFMDWYKYMLPLNIVFIATILLAGVLIKRKSKYTKLYIATSLSFTLSLYFFIVNITDWGIDIFVWLNNTIPGFVMFRNMYGKFAFAVAFTFALLLFVSLSVLIKELKRERIMKYLLYVVACIAILNSIPLLLGEFDDRPLWTTKNIHNDTKKLNEDFISMMTHIDENLEGGKILSLPLTSGNAFPVQDQYRENYYYNGVSPVLVFSGVNDFSGVLSFGPSGEQVLNSIRESDHESLGKILQLYNIKYAIVNKTILSDLQNSFVYSDNLYHLQDEEMYREILGDKIKDFGNKYSLYYINSKYQSEKLYITKDINEVTNERTDYDYRKNSSHEYEVFIENVQSNDKLVFMDPYLKGWVLKDESGEKINNHTTALGYVNGWEIPPKYYNKSQKFILQYEPHSYYRIVVGISALGYLVLILLLGTLLIKEKREK
ncbi:hypothetical protein ACFL2C_00085 [Patescibacteria group bacterium]